MHNFQFAIILGFCTTNFKNYEYASQMKKIHGHISEFCTDLTDEKKNSWVIIM